MGRHQYKNTFINLKNNMASQETSGPTTGRPEHRNPKKAERNDF